MRFPTGSNKAVARLSRKSLKASKVRNSVAIIAIVLTTILFTSVFTIGMGLMRSMEETTFRMVGGYSHGGFKDLTREQYEKLSKHPLIKEQGITRIIGIAENEQLIKHQTEIRYTDENVAKWMYLEVEEGRAPERIDEVAVDTTVLDLLGLPHELGIKVPVVFTVGETTLETELTLTGYWERLEGISVGQIRVAESFVDEHLKYQSKDSMDRWIGSIMLDVMLDNSFNIERKINQIAIDSGFVPEWDGKDGINVGINWAYVGAEDKEVEPMAVIGGVGAILLIMFTGYLIIYNVFQISVMSDIRFYGLLKTIGTTPKQIKKMVIRQAMHLSMIGIPIGLGVGYVIGNILLPMIMDTSTVKITKVSTSPIIFIGSTLFALITVLISCKKPGKIAARIVPIEASKYSEVKSNKIKERKASKNTPLHMAYHNVMRNKKKFIVVVISLALSIIVLNSVYTFTEGFDLDKYLSKNVVSDFILGSANYFNVTKHFTNEGDVPSLHYVEIVRSQDGVESVGAIYYETNDLRESKSKRGIQLYGVEENLLSKFQVVEGTIDEEKFATGDYMLEVIEVDDYGNVQMESSDYEIGEKVTVKSEVEGQGDRTYEVMAKVAMLHNMGQRITYGDEYGMAKQIVVSEKSFTAYVVEPLVMAYHVEVADTHEEQLEAFIKMYTTEVEKTMDYESKKYYVDGFQDFENMFLRVGIVASMIIGMVGMINFINVIFTSIHSRRGEFAILQSIGMTTKQLRHILVLEGVVYAVMTAVVVIVFSMGTSWFIVRPLCRGIWFFTYQFRLMPVILAIPAMLVLGAGVPACIHKVLGKQTIVERLRKMN